MRKKSIIAGIVLLFCVFLMPIYKNVQAEEMPGDRMSVRYKTHVQNVGWQNWIFDGQMSGTSGQGLRLEAIAIELDHFIPGMKIKYKTHVQNVGWQNWVYDGQMSGTSGMGYRLEGIQIMLEGAPAGYHIQYQVHVQNVGWQNWVQDGATAGTQGQALRLEGIRIRIVKDGTGLTGGLGLRYKTHVQNVGWQDWGYDGAFSGTEGYGYRLEGIAIELQNPVPGMKIKYKTHVQNVGWQDWSYDGAMSGTSGQSLRLEGIRIALENAPEWIHVKYQVHIQNIGWQDWVQDGEMAGTEGRSLRLEGIRIRIVDTKYYTYTTYTISLNDMVNQQLATNETALQVKNTSNIWEWRYAKIFNAEEGYYIYGQKLDADGKPVVDEAGKTVYEQQWTKSPTDYQNIKQQLIKNLDPTVILNDTRSMYEFLKLSYVDGTTAEQLNTLFRSDGVLAGKGQVFLDAAKANNINPIYLAAHSVLETGNGTSPLATGIEVNGVKVYNLFGIQAFDDNADYYGSTFASSQGWTTIDKAIYGGAAWISSRYINNPTYKQDTLYKMKWNPATPAVHQYATDVLWAYNQTAYIKQCFDMIRGAKLVFDVPVYK